LKEVISMRQKCIHSRIPATHECNTPRLTSIVPDGVVFKEYNRLPQGRGRMAGRSSPNSSIAQVEMVHPMYPDRIRFGIDIPKLLCKKTPVTSFDIEQSKASFCLRQANRFPSNQSRSALPNIPNPEEVLAYASDFFL
jgi:hypothetical protein